jgi:Cupin domain
VEGRSKWTVGDQKREASAGDVLIVRAGEPHKFINSIEPEQGTSCGVLGGWSANRTLLPEPDSDHVLWTRKRLDRRTCRKADFAGTTGLLSR